MNNNFKNLRSALLIATACSAISSHVIAAPITWGTVTTLTGESDINLSGNIVWAVNAGQDFLGGGGLLTIGADSVAFEDVNLDYNTFSSNTFGPIVDHIVGENTSITFDVTTRRDFIELDDMGNPTTGVAEMRALGTNDVDLIFDPIVDCGGPTCRVYDANTGNETLDSFLASSVFTDGRDSVADVVGGGPGPVSALNMQLRGLIAGHTYTIQLVATTARLDGTQTLGDGEGNFATGFDSPTTGGSGPAVVTGTFTADAGTQAVNVILEGNRNPGISLAILTDNAAAPPEANVPFPAIGLATMAALLAFVGIRRKNKIL